MLLIGLLALGLHLLRTSQERAEARPRVRKDPLLSGLGAVALIVFFACCIAFSLRPGTLGALSAEVRVQAQEHPCERLAAQRDRLVAAQEADHFSLIEATKQRMRPAAQDCLGLPSEAMTAEAVERLAAKTALADGTAPLDPRPAVGLAAIEPRVRDGGPATPPEVTELQPAEMQARGGLAELLADLGETEPPVADRPGPSAPANEPAARAPEVAEPATEPDPALEESEPTTDAAGPVADAAEPVTEPAEPGVAPIEPGAGPSQSAELETPPEPGPPPGADLNSPVFVATTALNYREGPSVDARRLGTLFPGARLMVLERDAGWAQVRLDDGQQGYVASEFLQPAP